MNDEEAIDECIGNFYTVANLQGRISYMLMSVHALRPDFLIQLLHYDPHQILWYNMLYGTGIHIYSRPNMRALNVFHRVVFSVLGSMMFNYSAMSVFRYIRERLADERPQFLAFMGFMAGRLMMLNLLAYLYHVDSRVPGTIRRDSLFESMYI